LQHKLVYIRLPNGKPVSLFPGAVHRDQESLQSSENILQTDTNIRLLYLIAERESNIGRLAVDHLESEGFTVRTFSMETAPSVIKRVELLRPSLVILETAMSKQPELGLCRSIRRAGTPVILLAANASEEERILGLESGADDYITQSSTGREMVARVRAVLRRFERQQRQPSTRPTLPPFLHSSIGIPGPTMRTGDIEIDASSMKISVRGSEIVTTNLEFRLLYYLAHNQARVFTRDQLLDAVWGTKNNVELRSVDACVQRLRRKIEPDPLRPTYLRTVWGAGYCLQVAG
jgi:DNA-binding response OmpR family regulator